MAGHPLIMPYGLPVIYRWALSVLKARWGCFDWNGLGAEPYFYFVHSYFPVPDEDAVIAATTEYGADRFASAIELPNLLACQFHPEKSQDAGLRLIRNFLGCPCPSPSP